MELQEKSKRIVFKGKTMLKFLLWCILLVMCWPLALLALIAYPFVWLLNRCSQKLLSLAGVEGAADLERSPHTEEELRLLFSAAQKRSGGGSLGRDIVLNALDLRRRFVREVMRPRQEIVAFDTDATISECLDIADKTRYSRFPLCTAGDLDQTLG